LWEIELIAVIAHNDRHMRTLFFSLISLWLAASAHGQTTIPNPLHADVATKPAPVPGARSPAQLTTAEDTRACGADWKQRKAELALKGETWQSFAKSCRATRKAARGV
jgi:hypothetical protein